MTFYTIDTEIFFPLQMNEDIVFLSLSSKMQEYNVDLTASKHCYLCVYTLIDMKNPDSFYKPYYGIKQLYL